MKTKILIAVATVLTAIGCTNGLAEQTTIKGKFLGEAPTEVSIKIPSSKLDTTIAVVENKFAIKLPTDRYAEASLSFDKNAQSFIPDGTVLTFTIDAENAVTVKSNMPELSATQWLVEEKEWEGTLKDQIQEIREAGKTDREEAMRLRDKFYEDIAEHNLKSLEAHKENECLLTSFIMTNLHSMGNLTDEEFEQMANERSEEFRSQRRIKSTLAAIEGKRQTAEGKKFVDFELEQPDGTKLSLSDFVGNGKYVLVDFWASWCGPCRAEIPNIAKVYEAHKGENFDVLSVAVWDKPEDSIAAAEQLGITWNKMYGGDKEVSSTYGFSGIPFIILIGPDGTILNRGLRGAEIEKTVAACLAK